MYAVYVASARIHTNISCCLVSCTCGSGTHAKQLGHVLVLAASYTDSVILWNGAAAGNRSPSIWRPAKLHVRDGSSTFLCKHVYSWIPVTLNILIANISLIKCPVDHCQAHSGWSQSLFLSTVAGVVTWSFSGSSLLLSKACCTWVWPFFWFGVSQANHSLHWTFLLEADHKSVTLSL